MTFYEQYLAEQTLANAKQAADDAKFYNKLQYDMQRLQHNAILRGGGIDEMLKEANNPPSLLKTLFWDW